jgi:hypothetical protein
VRLLAAVEAHRHEVEAEVVATVSLLAHSEESTAIAHRVRVVSLKGVGSRMRQRCLAALREVDFRVAFVPELQLARVIATRSAAIAERHLVREDTVAAFESSWAEREVATGPGIPRGISVLQTFAVSATAFEVGHIPTSLAIGIGTTAVPGSLEFGLVGLGFGICPPGIPWHHTSV